MSETIKSKRIDKWDVHYTLNILSVGETMDNQMVLTSSGVPAILQYLANMASAEVATITVHFKLRRGSKSAKASYKEACKKFIRSWLDQGAWASVDSSKVILVIARDLEGKRLNTQALFDRAGIVINVTEDDEGQRFAGKTLKRIKVITNALGLEVVNFQTGLVNEVDTYTRNAQVLLRGANSIKVKVLPEDTHHDGIFYVAAAFAKRFGIQGNRGSGRVLFSGGLVKGHAAIVPMREWAELKARHGIVGKVDVITTADNVKSEMHINAAAEWAFAMFSFMPVSLHPRANNCFAAKTNRKLASSIPFVLGENRRTLQDMLRGEVQERWDNYISGRNATTDIAAAWVESGRKLEDSYRLTAAGLGGIERFITKGYRGKEGDSERKKAQAFRGWDGEVLDVRVPTDTWFFYLPASIEAYLTSYSAAWAAGYRGVAPLSGGGLVWFEGEALVVADDIYERVAGILGGGDQDDRITVLFRKMLDGRKVLVLFRNPVGWMEYIAIDWTPNTYVSTWDMYDGSELSWTVFNEHGAKPIDCWNFTFVGLPPAGKGTKVVPYSSYDVLDIIDVLARAPQVGTYMLKVSLFDAVRNILLYRGIDIPPELLEALCPLEDVVDTIVQTMDADGLAAIEAECEVMLGRLADILAHYDLVVLDEQLVAENAKNSQDMALLEPFIEHNPSTKNVDRFAQFSFWTKGHHELLNWFDNFILPNRRNQINYEWEQFAQDERPVHGHAGFAVERREDARKNLADELGQVTKAKPGSGLAKAIDEFHATGVDSDKQAAWAEKWLPILSGAKDQFGTARRLLEAYFAAYKTDFIIFATPDVLGWWLNAINS